MGAWNDEKQKLLSKFLTPKKMADGGKVDPFDISQGDSSTLKMNGNVGSNVQSGQTSPEPSPNFNNPLDNTSQEAGPSTEGDNQEAIDQGIEKKGGDERTEDSHPGLQPDDLTNYIKDQEKQVDAWGPDKQAALMQHLQQGYKSPGNIIAKGGATLADAIMQGVSRAGSGGNLSAIDQREQQNLQRAQEMGKSLNEQNLSGLKEKQALEAQSPATPLGGANLPAIKAVASMYKMSPDQVQALMKSNPQTALKLLDQVGQFATGQMKAEIEQQMKLLEIQIQSAGIGVRQGELALQNKKEKIEHPILTAVDDWRNGGGGLPSGTSALSPGEVLRHTPDGKQAVFDSSTKKFKRYI